jgi:predicted RNA binding protein YcfA (HicA-like mRNA interferase family)
MAAGGHRYWTVTDFACDLDRPSCVDGPIGCAMKVREVIRLIEADGWYLVGTRGSHRQFLCPIERGKVTISGKASLDMPPGTLKSVMKQAGLKE